ncbi:MAG TPA: hypothetical protein VMZ28_27260 [Kofleriaceae bacterium]|nr:hypothetical protein [Kofleriaceae bacterium]
MILLGTALAACGGDAKKQGGADALPPQLAALGKLARATEHKAELKVEPAPGGNLALGDGAVLAVAANALTAPTTIKLRRVDLDLEALVVEARESWAYVYDTDVDVPAFGAPVELRIPLPRAKVSVARWDGTAWQPVALTDAPMATVRIEHFSGGTFSFLEWIAARTQATNVAINDEDDPSFKKRRVQTQYGNDALKHFLGVGEGYGGSRQSLCDEMKQMVMNYPGATFDFPPSEGIYDDNADLASFLHAGSAASVEAGRFHRMTAAMMPVIEAKLLGQPGGVTPAGMLRICIEAAGGNVPKGVLACHNFLKDITYLGRDFVETPQSNPMPDRFGEVARRLLTWRSGDTSPAGVYDKMGPLYHIFAAMTAGTWATSRIGGHAAAAGEALLRTFRHGGDTPDPEKGQADDCGAAVADVIRTRTPVTPDAGPVGKDGGPPAGGDAGPGVPDDAGPPADPSKKLSWNGHWAGKMRVAINMDDIATTTDQQMELDVSLVGDTVMMKNAAGQAMEFKLTPSNPNAAVGKGDVPDPKLVPGTTTKGTYHGTVFLRPDGKLYMALKSTITATGIPMPDQPPVTSTMVMDSVAILDRRR